MDREKQHPSALHFSQQFKRTPPLARGDDYDPAETVIRKTPPRAIGAASGAQPHADRFAGQMRTTMRQRAMAPIAGIPRCLRLLPPDLLERWLETKPRLLQRLSEELEAGELKIAHEILQELLYDTPRVQHLLNDVFLVEAYAQLPDEAKAIMPSTSLKSVLPGEALPAFAEFVDHLKQGSGQGCAEAMADLAELAPAAERLMAAKLKKVIPPPPAPAPSPPPELKRSMPTVQAAFTPPRGATPVEPGPVAPEVPDGVPAWLFAMGLTAEWSQFVTRLAGRNWGAAWEMAEQLALKVAERDAEHPELGGLAETMAMQVAEGMLLDLVPALQSRLEAADLFPVLAVGGTPLLVGCNDALAMSDWPSALEQLGMMPEDGQLDAVVAVVLAAAWQGIPPRAVAQATALDLVALWAPGAASGIHQFVSHLRNGDRRAADDALRALAQVGTSSTKIALMRAKLGWQSQHGASTFRR